MQKRNYRDQLLRFKRGWRWVPPSWNAQHPRIAEERVSEIPSLRRFQLNRREDESGVSGTGIVAIGVQFPSGRCIMEWVSKKTNAKSCGIYDSPDDLIEVHGHDGRTTMEWIDEAGV